MANGITKHEISKRTGYILLGFFTFYLVGPIRELVETTVDFNPIWIGVIGIAITLYFFEF